MKINHDGFALTIELQCQNAYQIVFESSAFIKPSAVFVCIGRTQLFTIGDAPGLPPITS